jgi:iron complex outermembrane receptor protein
MSLHFRRTMTYQRVLPACGVAAVCLAPLTALAQDAQSDSLQEVVVTAQKREQNLQDVGISIAAFSQDQLKDMGVSSVDQLGYAVPGVNIFQFGQQTTTTITIRGVSQNDFSDQNEAPVAVYQDGAYNSFIGGAGMNLFDVDRVEVLRGPQGTLFGRNATGGLIQIISRKPTNTFESYATVDAGQYGLVRLEGAVSGPLTNTLSARLSVSATRQDGFVTNTIGPDKEGTRDLSTRLQFDFHPSDTVDLLLSFRTVRDNVTGTVAYKAVPSEFFPGVQNGLVHYPANFAEWQGFCQNFFGSTPAPGSRDCFGYQDPDPANPWKVANDTAGVMSRTEFGTTATLTWKLSPNVQFTSITDYLKLDRDYLEDTDGTSLKLFNFFSNMRSWQFSQEWRLNGASGPLNWQTGLYYLDIQHDIVTGADANTGFNPAFDFFTTNHPRQGTNSYSGFGQIDWTFLSKWTATAGARYVVDRKHMNIDAQCSFGGCVTNGFTNPGILQGTGLNDAVAPGLTHLQNDMVAAKFELDFRPVEGLLTYASVNRGIKGGGFNAAAIENIPISYVRYKPETLLAYEVGAKSTFLNRRLQVNASVYYYDYHNYQAYTLIGFSPLVFNTDAINRGGELEVHFLPWRGMDISLGGAFENAIAKSVPLQFPNPPFVDQRPPQSPRFTENASIRQSWMLPNHATLSLQGTVNHVGQRYFNTINDPVLSDTGYTVENLRLSYAPDSDRWEAGVWVNNLTNTQYVLSAFDLSTTNGVVTRIYAPPRQVAATFTYRLK